MESAFSPLGGDLNAESEDYRYTHFMRRIDPSGQAGGEWGCFIHPDEFRALYFVGQGKLETSNGEQITQNQLKNWIDQTVVAFAEYLQHDIYPVLRRHRLPGTGNREIEDYAEFENLHPVRTQQRKYQLSLDRRPLLRLHSWKIYDALTGEAVLDLTNQAVPIHSRGYLKAAGGYRPFQIGGRYVGAGGGYYGRAGTWSGEDLLVHCVDYTSGYDRSSRVPRELKARILDQLIIEIASAFGDGIAGGLAGSSISVGPLHESIQTTLSATSSFFGSRLKEKQEANKRWDEQNLLKYRGIRFASS